MEGWCPKCGARRQAGPECPACGVIYAKVEAALAKGKEEYETPPLPKNEKLTHCPTCNREISKEATTCPHCGDNLGHEPSQTTPPQPPGVGKVRSGVGAGCLALIALVGIFAAISNRTSPENSSLPNTTGEFISLEEYGRKWPLTIQQGHLNCRSRTIARYEKKDVTITLDGKTWALNGSARGSGDFLPLEDIWRDNPEIEGAKMSVGDIIGRGLRLCR